MYLRDAKRSHLSKKYILKTSKKVDPQDLDDLEPIVSSTVTGGKRT